MTHDLFLLLNLCFTFVMVAFQFDWNYLCFNWGLAAAKFPLASRQISSERVPERLSWV